MRNGAGSTAIGSDLGIRWVGLRGLEPLTSSLSALAICGAEAPSSGDSLFLMCVRSARSVAALLSPLLSGGASYEPH